MTGLFLPVIPRSIPQHWTHSTGEAVTVAAAQQLVDGGILRYEHLPSGKQTVKDAIAAALAEFATAARPRPLSTDLGIVLSGDVSALEVEFDRYFADRGTPKIGHRKSAAANANPMALITAFDYQNGMHVEVIGPTLHALEAAWPRLGQTLLDVLEDGFMHGVRCLGPRQGIDWASHQYWMGEENELEYLRDNLHGDGHGKWEEIKEWTDEKVRAEWAKLGYECFTRAEFDKDFAPIWHRGCKPLKQLPEVLPAPHAHTAAQGAPLMEVLCGGNVPHKRRRRVAATPPSPGFDLFRADLFRDQWPEVRDLCQRIRALLKTDTECDNGYCQQATWENVPFMLRFHDDDCLPRIADDVWQQYFESGEAELSANSVFLWHDLPTLATALQRIRNQLIVTQASEDLLRLLVAPSEAKTRIQV